MADVHHNDGAGVDDDIEITAYLRELWGDCSRDELVKPVKSLEEKWKLLPAFLKLKGLVRQHIDSYNYFIKTEIKQIMMANQRITSDKKPNWYFQYNDIYIGGPTVAEKDANNRSVTPQECRLRDMTYSAQILVDVEYVHGQQIVRQNAVPIGRLPIMLRSSHCVQIGRAHV